MAPCRHPNARCRWRAAAAFALALAAFSAAAGPFGTAETCAAAGGEFRTGSGFSDWRGECVIVTGAAECRVKKGTRLPRDDGRVDCLMPRDASDLKAQCEGAGGIWGRGQPRARVDYCHLDRYVEQCRAQGGVWEARGLSGVPLCVLPAADAGKSCRGRYDCEFGCLYSGPRLKPGAPAAGQCAPDDAPFGCRAYVEDGRYVPGACVD